MYIGPITLVAQEAEDLSDRQSVCECGTGYPKKMTVAFQVSKLTTLP